MLSTLMTLDGPVRAEKYEMVTEVLLGTTLQNSIATVKGGWWKAGKV